MSKNPYENCEKARFHRLRVIESPFNGTGKYQVEQCQECGVVEQFELTDDNSSPEVRRYFMAHIRDFAQPLPSDPDMFEVFQFCNPKLAKKLEDEAKQKGKDADWQKEMSEGFRHALSSAIKDKDWKHVDSRGVDRSFKDVK
jgi:hypothetical protein